MKIVISSGHFGPGTGAVGPSPWGLDEGTEVRRVTDRVAEFLRSSPANAVIVVHDDVSSNDNDNLDYLVNATNEAFGGDADLSVSIHFNDTDPDTINPIGTECWYYSQDVLASDVSAAIAAASGLKDRGKKFSDGLAMLMRVDPPAILVEVAFVGSKADCELYRASFDPICAAIATAITGNEIEERPPPLRPPDEIEPPEGALFYAKGECSWFGGPEDDGVSASEGLAFIYEYETNPSLFLIEQPEGTTGLARRLNPAVYFVACRWDYDVTPKEQLANPMIKALVRANNREFLAWPADWGPHEDTGRSADLSLGLMQALCLETDDIVEVIYPAPFAMT